MRFLSFVAFVWWKFESLTGSVGVGKSYRESKLRNSTDSHTSLHAVEIVWCRVTSFLMFVQTCTTSLYSSSMHRTSMTDFLANNQKSLDFRFLMSRPISITIKVETTQTRKISNGQKPTKDEKSFRSVLMQAWTGKRIEEGKKISENPFFHSFNVFGFVCSSNRERYTTTNDIKQK